MSKAYKFSMTRQAWLAALISAAYSATSLAAAGRVEFVIGNVNALSSDGRERALSKGFDINSGDTIKTLDGRAQLRFSDGGYISLQPNTEFKVEDYNYDGKADGSEKSFFNLFKGGLRAITGVIGHGENKSAYRVNTPVATIGIRGTEYLAQYDTKLLVKVGDGAVFLSNGSGDLVLYKGQSGEVDASGKPQHSDQTPNVGSAGPKGASPQQVQDDQKNQQQNQQTYVAGDIKTQDGNPCVDSSTAAGCLSSISGDQFAALNTLLSGGIGNMSALNAASAQAVYTANNNFNNGSGVAGNVATTLAVNFSDYSANAVISGNVTAGAYAGANFAGGVTGGPASLTSTNGVINLGTGSVIFSNISTSYNSFQTMSVTSASLNSSNLSQSSVNYNITLPSAGSVTINANGSGTIVAGH